MTGSAHDLTSAVPVAPGAGDIIVDPAKVLDVAKVVEQQVTVLEDKLLTRLGELHIDSPSADIVSTNAIDAWNSLVADGEKSYAAQVRACGRLAALARVGAVGVDGRRAQKLREQRVSGAGQDRAGSVSGRI